VPGALSKETYLGFIGKESDVHLLYGFDKLRYRRLADHLEELIGTCFEVRSENMFKYNDKQALRLPRLSIGDCSPNTCNSYFGQINRSAACQQKMLTICEKDVSGFVFSFIIREIVNHSFDRILDWRNKVNSLERRHRLSRFTQIFNHCANARMFFEARAQPHGFQIAGAKKKMLLFSKSQAQIITNAKILL